MKRHHPLTRAALGIAALITIAISLNWLVSLTPLGNRGIDFTENKVHTLSSGTKSIVSALDTPVAIRYYASRNTDYMPEELKLHMRRVDDLLKEYSNLSGGKLTIENLDPVPDTDAEDSANLDGINGQRMDNQNLYFGLTVSCLDKSSVIPFLDPREETMLEYQLSKAIAEVSTAAKPKIGIMSALNLKGTPALVPGQAPIPGWVIYEQLKQSFELVDVPMLAPVLDPKVIKVLLLFHPAGITPETEFAVDQYLLKGGTVIACLDPYSVAAQMTSREDPLTGGGENALTSTLPTLLGAWGARFESNQVLADPALATKLGGDRLGLAILTLTRNNMPQKDDVITKDLGNAMLFLPGAILIDSAPGLAATSLMQSTPQAGFVDAIKASKIDPSLMTSFQSTGKTYDLATHLTGIFKTAFPKGKPAAKATKEPAGTAKNEALQTSVVPGHVFLIADVDAFYDRFAYNVQEVAGTRMATPNNGNAALLFNIMDQAVGSKFLIGSRSRTAVRRPFTVIQKMESDFNQTVGAKIAEFQDKQKAAQQKLSDLQAQKSGGTDLYLSPAQEDEIKKLRQEQVEYAKLIREQEKDLRRQKDKLSGEITILNVVAMPTLVILFGLGVFIKRRAATQAR
jgi:ABC-type uncharacterized transport system involved in gliding motility auxiliary subunit